METVRSITAYYPLFLVGGKPSTVRCELREVKAQGRRYIKTPFAMLDMTAGMTLESYLPYSGYYASEADCDNYLAREYPHWQEAAPIMTALAEARALHGAIVGPTRIQNRTGLNLLTDELNKAARGHRLVPIAKIRRAVKALQRRQGVPE